MGNKLGVQRRGRGKEREVLVGGKNKKVVCLILEDDDDEDDLIVQEKLTEEEKKRIEKRFQIMKEILSTEENYLNCLLTLLEVFKIPLAQKGIVEDEKLEKMFSNLEELIVVHLSIFYQISKRIGTWDSYKKSKSCVGTVFIENAEALRLYANYINGYNVSLDVVRKETNFNSKFKPFLSAASHNSRCQRLDLLSFLIMPVQRLPRYVLLLKDMFRHTSEDHPDYEDLEQAFKGMEAVTSYVNEQKRNAELIQQLLQLEAAFEKGLPMQLVKEGRSIVKEMVVRLKVQTKYRRKYADVCSFLFGDGILFAHKEIDYETWGEDWDEKSKEEKRELGRERKGERYEFICWVDLKRDTNVTLIDPSVLSIGNFQGEKETKVKVKCVSGEESAFGDWATLIQKLVDETTTPTTSSSSSSSSSSSLVPSTPDSLGTFSETGAVAYESHNFKKLLDYIKVEYEKEKQEYEREKQEKAGKVVPRGPSPSPSSSSSFTSNKPVKLCLVVDLANLLSDITFSLYETKKFETLSDAAEIALPFIFPSPSSTPFSSSSSLSFSSQKMRELAKVLNAVGDESIYLGRYAFTMFANQIFDDRLYPSSKKLIDEVLFARSSSSSSSSSLSSSPPSSSPSPPPSSSPSPSITNSFGNSNENLGIFDFESAPSLTKYLFSHDTLPDLFQWYTGIITPNLEKHQAFELYQHILDKELNYREPEEVEREERLRSASLVKRSLKSTETKERERTTKIRDTEEKRKREFYQGVGRGFVLGLFSILSEFETKFREGNSIEEWLFGYDQMKKKKEIAKAELLASWSWTNF